MSIFKSTLGGPLEEAIETLIAQAINWEACSATDAEEGSVESATQELDAARTHLRSLIDGTFAHLVAERDILINRIRISNAAMVDASSGNLSTVAEAIRINAITIDEKSIQLRELFQQADSYATSSEEDDQAA